MIHAGEQDLRENRLCSPKNFILKMISLMSRLATKPQALSTHTQIQRTRGSWLTAALLGDRTSSSVSPGAIQEKPVPLELGVLVHKEQLHVQDVWKDSSPASPSQVNGARGELENRGAVLLPG